MHIFTKFFIFYNFSFTNCNNFFIFNFKLHSILKHTKSVHFSSKGTDHIFKKKNEVGYMEKSSEISPTTP